MERLALHLAIITVLAAAALLVLGVLTEAEPTAALHPLLCPTAVPVATATPDGGPTYTPTLTHTPCLLELHSTPTPPPVTPPPVGGISLSPELTGLPLEAADSSGPGAGALAGIAAGVAAGAVALGSAAWYARRRANGR
ncbi:MAG: hypothetical protein IIC90_08160 [Chloroflexi bacterium]|nr:hypothetical protein [Chloroflexota bacterium]